MNTWIFQLNPKYFDVIGELNDPQIGSNLHRAVRQYRNLIKIGDTAILWLSGGEKAKIYGIGLITTSPDKMPIYPIEQKYWKGGADIIEHRVKVELTHNLLIYNIVKPIVRNHSGLDRLSILRNPRGTNFKVDDNQMNALTDLLRLKYDIYI